MCGDEGPYEYKIRRGLGHDQPGKITSAGGHIEPKGEYFVRFLKVEPLNYSVSTELLSQRLLSSSVVQTF